MKREKNCFQHGFFNENIKSSGKKTAAVTQRRVYFTLYFMLALTALCGSNIKMNARMKIIVWGGGGGSDGGPCARYHIFFNSAPCATINPVNIVIIYFCLIFNSSNSKNKWKWFRINVSKQFISHARRIGTSLFEYLYILGFWYIYVVSCLCCI